MSLPDPHLATLMCFGAVGVLGAALAGVIHAKLTSSWWWIALPANLLCVYMLGRTALLPSARGVPAIVIVSSGVWLLFYVYVLASDIGREEEDAPADQPDCERIE